MQKIKDNIVFKKILRFNLDNRDKWIKKEAALCLSGSFVIDIGAGSCPYKKYFQHCNYKSHDFKKLNPSQLRDKAGYCKIDFVGDITKIPIESDSVDVALCTEVIEHVPDPIKAIYEIARILKPGGILLLSAPLASGLHQEPYHFYGGYTPYWYQLFLRKAGFDQIIVKANGGFFSHYAQESLRLIHLFLTSKDWRALVFSPILMLALPWAVLISFLSKVLDILDQDKKYTVGYFVRAKKQMP